MEYEIIKEEDGKYFYSDGSIKVLSECEKKREVDSGLHPNWKYKLVRIIGKLLNMTLITNYPKWWNKKGKYYNIVDGDFVKK